MHAINDWCLRHGVAVRDVINSVYDNVTDPTSIALLRHRDLRNIENRNNVLAQNLLDYCRSSQYFALLIPSILKATHSKTMRNVTHNLSNFELGDNTHLFYLTLLCGFHACLQTNAINMEPTDLAQRFHEILSVLIEVAQTARLVQNNDLIFDSIRGIWSDIVDPRHEAEGPDFTRLKEQTLPNLISHRPPPVTTRPFQTTLSGFKIGAVKSHCFFYAHAFKHCQGCRYRHECIWCESDSHMLSDICIWN